MLDALSGEVIERKLYLFLYIFIILTSPISYIVFLIMIFTSVWYEEPTMMKRQTRKIRFPEEKQPAFQLSEKSLVLCIFLAGFLWDLCCSRVLKFIGHRVAAFTGYTLDTYTSMLVSLCCNGVNRGYVVAMSWAVAVADPHAPVQQMWSSSFLFVVRKLSFLRRWMQIEDVDNKPGIPTKATHDNAVLGITVTANAVLVLLAYLADVPVWFINIWFLLSYATMYFVNPDLDDDVLKLTTASVKAQATAYDGARSVLSTSSSRLICPLSPDEKGRSMIRQRSARYSLAPLPHTIF